MDRNNKGQFLKGNHINKKYNAYDLTKDYGKGYTLDGVEFIFDLEDYDKIKDYCWCLTKKRKI